MKKRFLIFLLIILAIIFQTSIFPLFFSRDNIPDFVLALTVSSVAVFGFQSMWIWVIISGFLLDIFSFSKLGTNIFSFIVFSYMVSFFSRRLILGEKSGGIIVGIIFISVITFLNNLWVKFAEVGFRPGFDNFLPEREIFWRIISNIIIFFVFVLIFKRILKKVLPSNNLIIGK